MLLILLPINYSDKAILLYKFIYLKHMIYIIGKESTKMRTLSGRNTRIRHSFFL